MLKLKEKQVRLKLWSKESTCGRNLKVNHLNIVRVAQRRNSIFSRIDSLLQSLKGESNNEKKHNNSWKLCWCASPQRTESMKDGLIIYLKKKNDFFCLQFFSICHCQLKNFEAFCGWIISGKGFAPCITGNPGNFRLRNEWIWVFGIRNTDQVIWNPSIGNSVSGIRNQRRGIQNPLLAWIP